jgi:hypothetical protein
MPIFGNVSKGYLLQRLDALSQDRSKLSQLLNDLHNAPDDLAGIYHKHGILRTAEEISHIRHHWCAAWWPHSQPVEPIIRRGFITAMEVALRDPKTNREREPHLPIDTYWIFYPGSSTQSVGPGGSPGGQPSVEVAITWSEQQVTLILLSPEPPSPGEPGTVDEPIFVIKRVKPAPGRQAVSESRVVKERQKTFPERPGTRRRGR